MGYQPAVKNLLDQINSAEGPGIPEMTVEENRAGLAALYKDLVGEPQEVKKVENINIPSHDGEKIGLRIYTPEGEGPLPVLVFYHGGGWVLGDLEVIDPIMRWVANETSTMVVSVDYRLAPEYKFPIPAEDCYTATKWVSENIQSYNGDPKRIAVAGDSAGGNLAAVIPLMAKDRGGPNISLQILLYPVTDFDTTTPSYVENGKGNYLETEAMYWFNDNYLNNEADKKNPYAAPMQARDVSGLPPALVFTAEHDVLRDEGEAYVERLRQSGVPVEHTRFDGQIHGFFWMPVIMDDAHKALAQIKNALKKQLSTTV
ncbi:alpha/beta hydrolase [Oceanobacillus senegalensis]|uniref:alpha/beta hydrolase n=1 Tax=Oceanobacillus senegalensis TaxID=1936063 RepID=UPI000A30A744|nr:alpha/beta hydrolase [Oceanobacillus senegalensis]